MAAAAALAAGPCGRTFGVAATRRGPAAPQSSSNAAAGCDCVRSHCPQPSSWRGRTGNPLGRQNRPLTASWNSSNVFHPLCPLEQSGRSSSSSSSRQIRRSSFRARSAAESESGYQVPPTAVGPRAGPRTSENKGVGGNEQQGKQAGGSKGQAAALSALERARAYAAAKKGDGSSGGLSIGGVGLQQETFSADSQPSIGYQVTSQLLSTPTAGKVREGSAVAVGGNKQGAAKSEDSAGAEVSIAQLATGAAYEQQQAQMVAALQAQRQQQQAEQAGSALTAGSNGASQGSASPATETKQQPGMVEVEIVTRDGIIRRQLSQSEMAQWDDSSSRSTYGARSSSSSSSRGAAAAGRKSAASPLQQRQPELKLSSNDFAGLGFAEDKGRSRMQLPAGLAAPLEPRPPGQLPEVEIITRDGGSQAGPQAGSDRGGDEVYKPKVATWGVFARPRDISKTYGGGRTIRPGQALETAEEKAAREARTRQLLEQYSLLVGLKIDPAVKQACEEALEEGDRLMEQGKLPEAMAQFDEVMKKVVFRNNLHAKAALQKALCLDSLARSDEARELYEKLVGHPDESVKRKARQMLFGFRAAESLRFNGGSTWDVEWYKKYFDSLAEKSLYNNVYKADSAAAEDAANNTMVEVLVYSILVMPLLLVAAAVVTKGL